MFSETVLKALQQALLTHKNVNSQYDNWPAERVHGFNQASAVIDEMLSGNHIESGWSIEDVHSRRSDCDMRQISADGEDDGLTWFHCDRHDMDSLDTFSCEKSGESTISDETARKVLALVDSEHDASIGINWDTIDYWLDRVEEDERND